MNNYLIVLCFVATLVAVSATDYCSICPKGYKHIACGHTGKFAASCPADAKMVPFTDSLKTFLVDAHNAKRNLIAGGGHPKHKPACRMATMQWDDELADVAAFNVKQCKMAHDKCRKTDRFPHSGQNLAYMSYYGKVNNVERLNETVQMWYDEVNNSNQKYIDEFPSNYRGPAIGHFTVMMSDRNIRVGCAASTYSVAGESYRIYLVACNYAYTNMGDAPIYAKCDKAGTSCKTRRNSRYPNLCSRAEKY